MAVADVDAHHRVAVGEVAIDRENTSRHRYRSTAGTSSATADMYTAWPPLIGTRESNTTTPTSGRTEMFCECLASGDDTQMNSR